MTTEHDRTEWIRLATVSTNANANVKPRRPLDIIPERYRQEIQPTEEGSAADMMALLRSEKR